ncbi:MAG TPA: NUMOD3 domain-containing DNA-binding protein [Patescibacteria group bacterium]|nr:NUMOD3 domain-containing DNA-binding protein [Patescibacteria group bacterium]
MIIYKTTNLINNKIYVGKDSHSNPTYLGSGKILKEAIVKYGKENFKKETLELRDGDNWEEREIYWIKEMNSQNRDIGYNILDGGNGRTSEDMSGPKHFNFGKQISDETKRKISIGNTGKIHSEEHKRKISEALKGFNNLNFGKHPSEETKKKLSDNHKGEKSFAFGKPSKLRGVPRSQETKIKISNSHKGKKLTSEHRKRISEGKKQAKEIKNENN